MRVRRLMSALGLAVGLVLFGAVVPVWANDVDGDGVDDLLDVCNNTPIGIPVDGSGRPLGDIDLDCDVDLVDYGLLQASFTGPLACVPDCTDRECGDDGCGGSCGTCLFVANEGSDSVISFPNDANGNVAPDTILQGAQTLLDQPVGVVVSASNQLLAVNQTGQSVITYNDAPNTNGNLNPDGFLFGASTELDEPTDLAFDSPNLLLVSDRFDDEIYTFDNAAPTLNGNFAPLRTITSNDLNDPWGIQFGASGTLYVANRGDNNVIVFHDAANINTTVAPDRIIESTVFTDVVDVFIDGGGSLLVLDFSGFVFTFNNAVTLNGNLAPDFTLTVPGAGALTGIVVGSDGTGYIVDNFNNAVYTYENIATINAAQNPDRTIQGANTQLDFPTRAYLIE